MDRAVAAAVRGGRAVSPRGRGPPAHIRRAVALLRDHGDTHLHHIHGPEMFGPSCTRLLLEPVGLDRLHPSAAGHPVFASRFLAVPRRAGINVP
ncbi:hypothetical protein [Streptomyces sp. NPDC005322]|uniref:hypothetical protein n=1 Tax=Streptomyces sp. NPDC005322 TaxID=3157032 RepID=UPI0033A9A6FB